MLQQWLLSILSNTKQFIVLKQMRGSRQTKNVEDSEAGEIFVF